MAKNPWGEEENKKPADNGWDKNSVNSKKIEDMLKKSTDKIDKIFTNKNGKQNGNNNFTKNYNNLFFLILGAVAVIWLLSGIHQIGPGQRGVISMLGKYSHIEAPGLHFRWPYPITDLEVVDADLQQKTEIGFRTPNRRGGSINNTKESLMLTGDKNIVDITFTVDWRVDTGHIPGEGEWPSVVKFAYNIENIPKLVKSVSEASIREVVGAMKLEDIITGSRAVVQQRTAELIQKAMDEYDSGIKIIRVNLQEAAPPEEVVDAFRDVIDAGSEAEVKINNANRYANEKIPQAEAKSEEIYEEAEAYYARVVANSRGQADRFSQVYDAYRKSPEVTKKRLYLETMEKISSNSDKMVIDNSIGNSVLPLLPLENKLDK